MHVDSDIYAICGNMHVISDDSSHFTISGFDLISYRLHAKYGRDMYVT